MRVKIVYDAANDDTKIIDIDSGAILEGVTKVKYAINSETDSRNIKVIIYLTDVPVEIVGHVAGIDSSMLDEIEKYRDRYYRAIRGI